ncbi:MAG: hypothetical protein H6739_28890 [Alphaproteobacteria bacterium]|nr:hypothetical protein [Alphaproteobacteria bacterium]
MSWERVVILGEDLAHEGFLRSLSKVQSWKIVSQHIAPDGDGDAGDWVIRQLPIRLSELRAMSDPSLGLLVAIDGDNKGAAVRRTMCNQALRSCGMGLLGERDPLALLIPTWSIDTWAVFFCKGRIIPEDKKAKSAASSLFIARHPGFLAPGAVVEDAPKPWKPKALNQLVKGFLGDTSDPALPSPDLAREAFRRCMAG